MSSAASEGSTISNIGASQPPARVTRYTAVRSKQERRMGAGSLLSGGLSVAELKQQLNRAGTGTMSSNFSHTARAHKAQEIPLTGMEKETTPRRRPQQSLKLDTCCLGSVALPHPHRNPGSPRFCQLGTSHDGGSRLLYVSRETATSL